jgi:hypothetical protein
MRTATLMMIALAAATTLAACATTEAGPPPQPDFSEVTVTPAPDHATLYAACFRQAIDGRTYGRASDGGGDELLLFRCDGEPAEAMFAALGPWSAQIGSEWRAEGRTWRSTAKVQRNLFGVDYCSATDAGAAPRCVISFNAGDFLDQ